MTKSRMNWTPERLHLLRMLHASGMGSKAIGRVFGISPDSVRSAISRRIKVGFAQHMLSTTPLDDLQWLANQSGTGEDLPDVMARLIRAARNAQRYGWVPDAPET